MISVIGMLQVRLSALAASLGRFAGGSSSCAGERRRSAVATVLIVLLISAAAAQESERPGEAVRTIVSRETEFFEFARDHGRRAAFLEFLADDAVMFEPGPVNAKQMWTKRPEDSSALAWQP